MRKPLLKKTLILGLLVLISTSIFLWIKPIKKDNIHTEQEHRETGGKEAQEFFEQMIRNPKTGKIPLENLVNISNKMQIEARTTKKEVVLTFKGV